MQFIDEQLLKFKQQIELAIVSGGNKGKKSIMRSSKLINLIHDAVKYEFINHGIQEYNIYPPLRYPKMVLGEVYLIPVHEYDDDLVKRNIVGFKSYPTDLEKYISFFASINNRKFEEGENTEAYAYERCALLIVDFNRAKPYLFSNSAELKRAGLISANFNIEYAELNFQNFVEDIINIYSFRYNIDNLLHH